MPKFKVIEIYEVRYRVARIVEAKDEYDALDEFRLLQEEKPKRLVESEPISGVWVESYGNHK